MNLHIARKIPLNRFSHTVRASQAVLQYGVGAMVDFPDQTLMTAAPEYWQERVIKIHDERLENALHVDYLGMPGNKDDLHGKEGISYTRFPEWYFCPKCRIFKSLVEWEKDYLRMTSKKQKEEDPYMVKHILCPICKQGLVVTRIITVCADGHIDDFPWVKWVHCQNMVGRKRICEHPTITFKTEASATEGLEGLVVTCESCKAKTTLSNAFDNNFLFELDKKTNYEYDFKCTGRHPWKNSYKPCINYPKVLQRGSSSVYFPFTVSSLVIPPYSSILTTKIENSIAFSECKTTIADFIKMSGITREIKDVFINQQIINYADKIGLEVGISKEQIKPILERKWQNPISETYDISDIKYRAEEYEALNGEISFESDDYGDFQRESIDIDKYNIPFIKQISLIHKIREVRALLGFSRIKPIDKSEPVGNQGNFVSIKEHSTNWYPAYEVFGEGVFIEFDNCQIDLWRNDNFEIKRRVDILNDNYKKSFIGSNNQRIITSKFILLHTISHLLIKQLSFECGYSIASLRERIYSGESSDGKVMSGIFIYTASGDSEGTLGGLVRQGRPDTFPSIYRKAIESGMTCSNDPVCCLSLGQGRDSLNLSACYSCCLIPETSCEEYNVFLDRGMVVGTFSNQKLGLFYNQLFGEKNWSEHVSRTDEILVNNKLNKNNLIAVSGTDMSDVGYIEIWINILQYVDGQSEKQLIKDILDNVDLFSNKEKPIWNCSFMVSGDSEQYKCDLLWEKSKVAYFSTDNQDEYIIANESEWTCFYGNDASCSFDVIIDKIKDR